MPQKIIVCRLGAIGDSIICTPLFRYLKQQLKAEVYTLTSNQGMEIYKNNPNIDKIIHHKKDSIENKHLRTYFDSLKQAYECDKMIDLCESVEVNLVTHPVDPRYNFTKQERYKMCNKNYYEEVFKFADVDLFKPVLGISGKFGCKMPVGIDFKPELFFTPREEGVMQKFFRQFKDKFVVLWGLSGSSRNKIYPYVFDVVTILTEKYKDIVFITVGDGFCQILEAPFKDNKRVFRKSGIWEIRESMLACKYASLVVSPDTGILHASGVWDTPKIGILTHSTIENITKHFKNDYSLEAVGVDCAPCFRLHYNSSVSCNLAEDRLTPICQAWGFPPDRIIKRIEEVKCKRK